MNLALAEVPNRVFQGVVPAIIATVDPSGTPNVTYLSQVHRVDDSHVALSYQFFNKTKQNVLDNGRAAVQLLDPLTGEAYGLELHFVRSETSGSLFDSMAVRIDVIASHTGMRGVFRLLGADVYRVIRCDRVEGFILPSPADGDDEPAPPSSHFERSELRALQLVTQRACKAASLDELLSGVLEAIDQAFGFRHSMMLTPDETGQRLVAVATRGYGDEGIGAEVAMGEGLIGTVARERRALRVASVDEALRYARAVRGEVAQTRARRDLRPEVPLAGLTDAESQMAVPLVVGDRLVGVLAFESRDRLAFDEWDEAFLDIVAGQVAVRMESVTRNEGAESEPPPARARPVEAREVGPPSPSGPVTPPRRFKLFRSDDCVFVDDEYLVRNLPGRILWKILRAHAGSGRADFSNRELRLDPALGLPEIRDNLESRLVLLRKRLEQRCPELRLVPTSRGHFRLEVACAVQLEESE